MMKGKKRPIEWIHADERGAVLYGSITALAEALNVPYRVVSRYMKLGYTGDADIGGTGKNNFTFAEIRRRERLQAAFNRHGIKWEGNEQ
jgi:hypothetical protein